MFYATRSRAIVVLSLLLFGIASCASPAPSDSSSVSLEADRISGRVTREDGGAVDGTTIDIMRASDQYVVDTQTLVAEKDGTYQSKRLIAGQYIVRFTPAAETALSEVYYDNASSAETAKAVRIPGVPASIDAVLRAPVVGEVDWDLSSSCGLPQYVEVSGMRVYCVLPARPGNRLPKEIGDYDKDCQITISITLSCAVGVTPTLTLVSAAGGPGVDVSLTEDGSGGFTGTISSLDLTTVQGSGTLHLSWQCSGGTSQSQDLGALGFCDPGGRVTDPTGIPVPDVTVTLYQHRGVIPGSATCQTQPPNPLGNTVLAPEHWMLWNAVVPQPATGGTAPGGIVPTYRSIKTDANGEYGWQAPDGCYSVAASASDADCVGTTFPVRSPMVGVAGVQEVDTLDLQLPMGCVGNPGTPQPPSDDHG